MMPKDQVLPSFIQDKNPRKSRYMIKFDLLESLGRSFQIETNKRFDQRILSFQIEICSPVIDYQQLKMFLFKFLKPVIDYISLVIDYQRGFSENNFQETYLFKCFINGHSNVLKRVFIAQTVLSSRKIESFSELKCLILSKRFLGQPLAYSIRNF